MVNNFTCKNVMPGIGCGLWEFLALGIIFYIEAIFSIIYLKKLFPKRKFSSFDKMQFLFWLAIGIWLLYKGTLFIIPVNYNQLTYRIFFVSFPAILYVFPLTVLVRLVCDALFTYNSPGARLQIFIKVLFLSFITIYFMIGITLSIGDVSDSDDPGSSISLWYGCTNILTVLFIAIPSNKLIKLIQSHGMQNYENCTTKSKIGLVFFVIIYSLRGLYNILSYFSINPLQTYLNKELSNVERFPPTNVRIITWFYYFVFDAISALLLILGAVILYNHSKQMASDPFFVRFPSDQGI